MRTRTIFEALRAAEYRMRNRHFAHRERFYSPDREERRKAAQAARFERELLRRIDHYDWYEARQRFFDTSDALGIHPERTEQARESARLEMNAAYKRFAAHPAEQAKADKWRKENGI